MLHSRTFPLERIKDKTLTLRNKLHLFSKLTPVFSTECHLKQLNHHLFFEGWERMGRET